MVRRKEIIEETQPSLVISIHQNFYASSSPRGAQVFYNANNPSGNRLAIELQNMLNNLYAEEGVKPRKETAAQYYMLECTTYPSVIVECGFLSNAKDETLLISLAWQKKLSSAIAQGVAAYLSDGSV